MDGNTKDCVLVDLMLMVPNSVKATGSHSTGHIHSCTGAGVGGGVHVVGGGVGGVVGRVVPVVQSWST